MNGGPPSGPDLAEGLSVPYSDLSLELPPAMLKHLFLGASLLLLTTVQAEAAFLTDGIHDAKQTQIEGWLGQGDLNFDLIYGKVAGDTSTTFHDAVDGKGPTITLVEITDPRVGRFWIGGYNPQSWNREIVNATPNDADRTAFIFNLGYYDNADPNVGFMAKQFLSTQTNVAFGGDTGWEQTRNITNGQLDGPHFGFRDLWVLPSLGTVWLQAKSYDTYNESITYGNVYNDATTIIGSPYKRYGAYIQIGRIETYTFKSVNAVAPVASAVPEPSSLVLAGFAGIGVLLRYRRKRGQQNRSKSSQAVS